MLVRQYDPFYTQVWNGLTAMQKKALVAVVTESGLHLQSMRVVASTGVSPSSMRKSLESPTAQDIVRQVESSGAILFRFEDPFFASWIRLFIF